AYLNTIYFANGAYGVERAARTYFGHAARKLTLPQAALLAGIPEDPSRYDPVAHPLKAPMPRPQDVHLSGVVGQAPYFGEYVKQQLISRFGAKRVFGGGFRVH